MFHKRRMERKTKCYKPENFSCPRDSYPSFDPKCPPWKDMNLEAIKKCEANFFCEVLCRLSKELKCAHDLDDLEDIIEMAARFLHASAAKEKAIACQLAVSNGFSLEKQDPDFKFLCNDTMFDEQWSEENSDSEESFSDEFDSSSQED